jgi:hypothetical protein
MRTDHAWSRAVLRALRYAALCCALGTSLVASAAGAGSAPPGTVSNILPQSYSASSQLFFFNQSATPAGHPACATAAGRWVINVATPAGQAMASVILTAYSLGKPVSVMGTGACADWGDTESVLYVVMP